MESIVLSHPFSLLACLALGCLAAGAFYRLHLSPTARFPGPRLAALTFWYEFYYDVLCQGRYTWKIQELHRQYGPLVRINPTELHIADPTFYHSIYVASSRRTDKWDYSARMFGTSLAAVGTTNHELHRLRRSALNVFFSKRSISALEPVIQRVINHACHLLEHQGTGGRVLNLRNFFAAFSADLIGDVAFGRAYGLVDRPAFEPGWQKLMMDLSRATHLMKQFSWAYVVLNRLPASLVSLLHPPAKQLFDIRSNIRRKIDQTKASLETDEETKVMDDTHHPSVLHSLLSSSDLPAAELATPRLEDEAFTLLGAGTITTAHTLTTILYYVLSNSRIKLKLESELTKLYSSLPSNQPMPSLSALEHCPYLSAIVSEGLRLSFGVSHRLPRISPDTTLHYEGIMDGKAYDYVIPAGVPVSMTQMLVHLDPATYPSPRTFDPERWLPSTCDSEEEKEQLKRRKHYFVPFSKGTRMCAGIHLAYAELYLMLGAMFAPGGLGSRMELFQTGPEDVDCVHDFFNPSPKLDSEGVRVVLKEEGTA